MLGLNIKLLGIQTEWRTINNNNNLLAYTVDVITYKLYKN